MERERSSEMNSALLKEPLQSAAERMRAIAAKLRERGQ
jgi:hypothetical protein